MGSRDSEGFDIVIIIKISVVSNEEVFESLVNVNDNFNTLHVCMTLT